MALPFFLIFGIHIAFFIMKIHETPKGFDLHRLRTSELPCSSVTGNRNNNPPLTDQAPSSFFGTVFGV
jgi:hypothetical protein